jgi:integrase
MPIVSNRKYYQEGALERASRRSGPDVWVYRWRETNADGVRVQRKRVIGSIAEYKTLSQARQACDSLRLAANAASDSPTVVRVETVTVGSAWGHFQLLELRDPDVDRSPTTIETYEDNFNRYILPRWRDVPIKDVTPVAVEQWLRALKQLAAGTKAKFRNQMSCLFAHAMRHRLLITPDGINPIKLVRQGAKSEVIFDTLELDEIKAILEQITQTHIRVILIVAACTALRRSEVRGLKWKDIDLDSCWITLKRGIVRKHQTKMKTKESRKGVPILPELAEILASWRRETLYQQDDNWVFASPYTSGRSPYWLESILEDHLKPAVAAAGINKSVAWHTFRRSFGSLMSDRGESVKVVQELLRHTNPQITMQLYQKGSETAKRNALQHTSELFVDPPLVMA